MSKRKTTGAFGSLVVAALLLMFPNQFASVLMKVSGIFSKIIGGMLLKALGI
jgi:hypothetical protein